MHIPVLLKEVIEQLNPKPKDFIIDGTIGSGGHSLEIFSRISPGGVLLGVDLDKNLLKLAKKRILAKFGNKAKTTKLILAEGNYADLPKILRKKKLPKADGFLLDLGFSSDQLNSGKGFSFMLDEPLIMTYGTGKPVKDIIRDLSEQELAKIIFEFSNERFSRVIARAIKKREKAKPIETSGELAEIIKKSLPKNYERGRINPATRTFQALRIYANRELDNLKKVLSSLSEILKSGGRIVVISFHSLEDAIVKNYFKAMEKEKKLKILNKKPIVPSTDEIKKNPSSRSAKLRAAIII